MESAYKLAIEIVANAKNFETKITEVGGSTDKVAGKIKAATNENSKFAGSFGKIGAGIGTFMAIAGGAAGVIGVLKGSIEAVEGPGDKFEEIIAGGKSALFEFQRALATMNFSDLFKNLSEGYERGRKFAEVMDALADEGAYTNYKGSLLKVQSSELREKIRDYTLDISAREKYSEERRAIEEELHDKTVKFAEKEYLAFVDNWEKTNKVKNEVAEEAYKISLTFSDAELDALEQNEKYKRNNLDGFTRAQLDTLNAISQERKDAFAVVQKINKGEKDGLIKLFDAKTRYNDISAEANNRLGLSIRENTMLLGKEETALGKVVTRLQQISTAGKLAPTGVGSTPIGAMTMPGLQGTNNKGAIISDSNAVDVALYKLIDTSTLLSKVQPFDLMKQSLQEFTGVLASGASSYKNFAKSIATSAKQIIGALLAESVATSISTNLKANAKFMAAAGPFSVLLIPLIAGAAAGAAKTAFNSLIPSFASGAIAYGPTIAQVGEYPGASRDPEVISPLSKLKELMGTSVTPVPQRMRLAIDGGGSLYGYLEYRQTHLNNYR